MRRTGRVVVGACALLALCAIPAFAGGKGPLIPENQYEGRLDGEPQSYVGFNLKRGDNPIVKKVFVRSPFRCTGGNAGHEEFPVRGRFKVGEDGKFSDRVRYNVQGVPVRAKFKGKLKKRGRARGTFKFVAFPPSAPPRGTDRCTFPKLDWKAKRGKEIRIVKPL